MQSVHVAGVRDFELSAEIVAALFTSRFDSRAMLSWGALLEWLIAVRELPPQLDDGDAGDRPIRLCQVAWHTTAVLEAVDSLHCRTQPGGPLLVALGGGGGLLLSAAATRAQVRASAAVAVGELGERVSAQSFYAELASSALEVEPTARAVEYAWFGEAGAAASLIDLEGREAGFIVGPSALDAALHLAFACAQRGVGRAGDRRHLGAALAIDEVIVIASGVPRTLSVTARATDNEPRLALDVSLFDHHAVELARLVGVTFEDSAAMNARLATHLSQVFEAIVRACLPAVDLEPSSALPALGASSIDLVRIGSLASEWLDWAPPLAEFLRTPSVSGLVQLYLARDRPHPLATSDALTATERQLWFLEQATNAAGSYNEGFAWRIRGALSSDALERALGHVQRCHPALRSYFPLFDGTPERRLAARPCALERAETPGHVHSDSALLDRTITAQICRPFDLEHVPPFRCTLLQHAADDATLVLSAHHIVCDAWSFARVIVPELCAAYAALRQAPELPLAAARVERELQHRELDPVGRARAEAHFREALGDLPHVLDFPFDQPRPAVQTHRGGFVHRPLTAARWGAVKSLARDLGHSPFVVCLAAHEILLQRYARSAEFCLGVPVSLRRDSGDAGKVGCLINLSVIRARLDLSHTFQAHCAQVKQDLLDTLQFDQFALGDIVRAVAPVRSLSHTPLVQAVFGYRELAGAKLELPGATATPLVVHNRHAKFDLTLSIDDYGDDAQLSLEYASDLLERQSAESLLDHFEALVDELVLRPGAQIGSLRLVSPREQKRIAAYELGPVRDVPAPPLGIQILAHVPEHARVLRTTTRDWDAAALRDFSSRIAAALRRSGVRPGELVVICVPRSAEWVAAVLAILELGAAYFPLDPRQPPARIAHGVARSGARVVITLDAAFAPEPTSDQHVIELGALPTAGDEPEPNARSRAPHAPHDPVYAIMTSGSTGLPRIAAVAQAGFSNLLAFYSELLTLTAADHVVLATSIGFDLTQKNLFAALLAGAELVIDDADEFDPTRLTDLIESHAVSVLNCTPTLAYAIVASAAGSAFRKLRSLRALVLGGEPIDEKLLRPWIDHPSCSAHIVNSYGPTECSDVVTAHVARAGVPSGTNLGRPIQNARCRVFDAAGRLAGIGVPGELCLGGAPLGLGYLGDPAATAMKFVHYQGDRLYRTGDLVRWNHAGELQYLGRIDTQVKIRGYRIELAEIEAALEQQASVEDAVVISRADLGQATLVGYVVLSPAAEGCERLALERRLRRDLARTLPSYMLPRAIVPIDRVPRTASGKLDRNALLGLPWEPAAEPSLEPSTEHDPIFSVVRDAYSEVLGLSTIASDSDFFELGGHSLAAVELVARLEADLGVRLRAAAVFERPILAELASHLAESLNRGLQGVGHSIDAPASTSPVG